MTCLFLCIFNNPKYEQISYQGDKERDILKMFPYPFELGNVGKSHQFWGANVAN